MLSVPTVTFPKYVRWHNDKRGSRVARVTFVVTLSPKLKLLLVLAMVVRVVFVLV